MRARAGFTLIETVLAASLGAILVLMVVGMLGFMDRAESRQSERIEQVDGVARVHTVMERAFSSLVVADMNAAQQAAALTATSVTETPAKKKRETARLLVKQDESDSLKAIMNRLNVRGNVQRMEVVLDRALLPQNFAQGMGGSLASSAQASQLESDFLPIPGPVRGVFELRPDRATIRTGTPPPRREDGREGWTLWWRPLVFGDAEDDPTLIDPTEDPRAIPLIAGLEQCSWKAFVDRERKDEIRVETYLNLPAYMEVEIKTLGGYYANWMFEVQWTVGAEETEKSKTDGKIDARNEAGNGGRNRAEPMSTGLGGGGRSK